jgi:hypothetical protein
VPVLQRAALLVLMLAALMVAGQGAIELQSALGRAAGGLPWLQLLKIVGGLAVPAWAWRQLRRLDRERAVAMEVHARKPGRRFQADGNPILQAIVLTGLLGATTLLFLMDLGRGQGLLVMGMLAVTIYVGFVAISGQPDDTPVLGMDATGLDHVWFGRVPWNQVHGIGLEQQELVIQRRTYRVPVLVLGVSHPDRYQARAPVAVRVGQEEFMGTGATYGELRIPLGPTEERPARVVLVAKGLRDQVAPPTLPGWRVGMTAVEVRRLMASAEATTRA